MLTACWSSQSQEANDIAESHGLMDGSSPPLPFTGVCLNESPLLLSFTAVGLTALDTTGKNTASREASLSPICGV